MKEIYTVGHGSRALTDFIELLSTVEIGILVDVRAHPVSGRHPHFRRERLCTELEHTGIEYQWMGDRLGGRRTSRSDSPHIALSRTLRGFADHMRSNDFRTASHTLLAIAGHSRLALMCAERQPAFCHRLLIADYLTYQGANITHLIDFNERRLHRMHAAARRVSNDLVYDRYATGQLDL